MPSTDKKSFVRSDRTITTTVRPPSSVVAAIDAEARSSNRWRSEVIRDLLDSYLDAEVTRVDAYSVRLVYAQLRSKLHDTPVSFACPRRRLMTYKIAVRMLRARSLAGLLTIAAVDRLGIASLETAA
jgi:hypothetical protein